MDIKNAKIRIPQEIPELKTGKLRVSAYTEDYRGEFYNISVDKLIPFKNQARRYFDQGSLKSLSDTIKEHGVRQPLTVVSADNADGQYEIVSGERRYRAALLAGLKSVPCIILHDRAKAEEIAIIENIQREDLHPIELMKAYQSLLQRGVCSSMQEIADKLSVAKSSVVEIINLKNLEESTKEILLNNKISNRDFLRALSKSNKNEQQKLLDDYLKNKVIKTKNKSINKKIKIISIVSENDNLTLDHNQVNKLTHAQTNQLKNLLTSLLEQLSI